MSDEREVEIAVVFPGQGAQEFGMLDAFRNTTAFDERREIASAALNCDLLSADPDRNEVGSIMTILASSFAWEDYCQAHGTPGAIAGYSVGTWTALWASGMIDFPTLIDLATKRAHLMNAAAVDRPGAMLALVGLSKEEAQDIVNRSQSGGAEIHIANLNAPGNVTLAGEAVGLKRVEELARETGVRQVKRLSVDGAWHCPMMSAAAREFETVLAEVPFSDPVMPILDNVTGSHLPKDLPALRHQLAIHLERPVQWERTIRTMIDAGCEQFVEVGHGSMLSRFGFFIDRSKTHRTFAAESCAV